MGGGAEHAGGPVTQVFRGRGGRRGGRCGRSELVVLRPQGLHLGLEFGDSPSGLGDECVHDWTVVAATDGRELLRRDCT